MTTCREGIALVGRALAEAQPTVLAIADHFAVGVYGVQLKEFQTADVLAFAPRSSRCCLGRTRLPHRPGHTLYNDHSWLQRLPAQVAPEKCER